MEETVDKIQFNLRWTHVIKYDIHHNTCNYIKANTQTSLVALI